MGPRLSKYLENMTYFHQIPKFSIDLIVKWVKICYKSCDFNVWKAWHIEMMQFVWIGGKVGGNVLKCCGIFKYQKTTIPLSFLKHSSKPWPNIQLIFFFNSQLLFDKLFYWFTSACNLFKHIQIAILIKTILVSKKIIWFYQRMHMFMTFYQHRI